MPIELSTPVTYLKGVGPRRAEALRRLELELFQPVDLTHTPALAEKV